jgi:hypothetical protein
MTCWGLLIKIQHLHSPSAHFWEVPGNTFTLYVNCRNSSSYCWAALPAGLLDGTERMPSKGRRHISLQFLNIADEKIRMLIEMASGRRASRLLEAARQQGAFSKPVH